MLISDCRGRREALWTTIFAERPDVCNHNIETVARLQRAVRPQAGYARSLSVLSRSVDAGLTTKSGLVVGMGETRDEIDATLADLAAVGVSIVTIGQYLRPTTQPPSGGAVVDPGGLRASSPRSGTTWGSPMSSRRRSPVPATTPAQPPVGRHLTGGRCHRRGATLRRPSWDYWHATRSTTNASRVREKRWVVRPAYATGTVYHDAVDATAT